MALPQSLIDELSSRCDIVEIVSRYVTLKKSGGNYFGLCPFHNEKTPSFSVSSDKQIYNCFGCGEGGGAISFIMKLEGLEYIDAIRFLAKIYNMQVPEQGVSPENSQKRDRLLNLMRDTARFYYNNLQLPQSELAKQYLKNRALRKKTMDNFGLGFAPNSWTK